MELGFSYLDLNKFPSEPYSSFLERSYFIINNKDEEDIIELSKYLYSIKYLGCKYSDEIMTKLNKLAKNAGVKI